MVFGEVGHTDAGCKGKQADAEGDVLEEVGPAGADEGVGLPPVAVVVRVAVYSGMG